MNKITAPSLAAFKARREKFAVLTCYDASMARLLDEAGVEAILVGDSVGNVKMGHGNTLPVSLEDMLVYTKAARRGAARALLTADMPFLTYETSPRDAVRNAGRLVKEGGAEAVKLEGGDAPALAAVRAVARVKIPVMAHLGLTPQSLLKLGGYRVRGKTPAEAEELLGQAKALEAAGAFALVLEAVPAALARRVTESLSIPTIGIGAGPHCDGQVLVLDDMLGLSDGEPPRFVRRYASLRAAAARAVRAYRDDVKAGRFPRKEHTYG
jgi:3-methyl-2-oxobutanoate hydroxymethyltransferase